MNRDFIKFAYNLKMLENNYMTNSFSHIIVTVLIKIFYLKLSLFIYACFLKD